MRFIKEFLHLSLTLSRHKDPLTARLIPSMLGAHRALGREILMSSLARAVYVSPFISDAGSQFLLRHSATRKFLTA